MGVPPMFRSPGRYAPPRRDARELCGSNSLWSALVPSPFPA